MEMEREPIRGQPQAPRPDWRLIAAVVSLVCIGLVSLAYAVRERRHATQLAAENNKMATALSQTQSQVNALAARLNAMSLEASASPSLSMQPTPKETHTSPTAPVVSRKSRTSSRPVDNGRWKRIEDQLAANQQAIATTQRDVEKARTDMEGEVSSARDEFNGSIARTHDEMVALEKKGERNYYEFDLQRSKQFQRVGPLNLSLRKTNSKHQHYDMAMLVDDRLLNKKHVNLYEPVLIYPADSHQPLEIVVNRITQEGAHGYISAPRYPETQSAGPAGAARSESTPAASGNGPTASEGAATAQGSLSPGPSERL